MVLLLIQHDPRVSYLGIYLIRQRLRPVNFSIFADRIYFVR